MHQALGAGPVRACRDGETRTPIYRFWRPALYQLRHIPIREAVQTREAACGSPPAAPESRSAVTYSRSLPGRFRCPSRDGSMKPSVASWLPVHQAGADAELIIRKPYPGFIGDAIYLQASLVTPEDLRFRSP